MASTEIRDRRRVLRYRSLVIKQMVQMKNRISGLLMETGVDYNKRRLHKVGYFEDLLSTNKEVNQSIRPLLKLSRETIDRSQRLDYALVTSLERDPLLRERLLASHVELPVPATQLGDRVAGLTRFHVSQGTGSRALPEEVTG